MTLEYQRLDFANFETRLLNIHPLNHASGTKSGTVRGHLEHISLIDPPQYYALSYCWGDPSITTPVIIDQQKVRVTVNLEAALRELRRRGIVKVWIDALCINQNDDFERGNQVQRMGEVYARAAKVFAWLGPSSSESTTAFKALKEALDGKSATKIDAAAVRSLFQRPFWRRVWIIQEVAKAKDVTLICSAESFEWSDLRSAVEKSSIQQLLSTTQSHILAGLHEFRTREHDMRPMSLAAALLNSCKSLASDPRDKIYALLGLASDGSTVVPLPNYSYNASTMAIQAAQRMIKGQRRISTLLLARRRKKGLVEALPSWMPDLLHLEKHYTPWIAERIDDRHWMSQVDIRMTDSLLELPCSFVTSVFSVSKSLSSKTELQGVFQDPNEYKQIASDDIAFLSDLHGCLTLWRGWHGWYRQDLRRSQRCLFHFVSQCLGRSNHYVPKGLWQWVNTNADLETGNGTLKEVLKRVYRWSVIASCLDHDAKESRERDCQLLEAGLRQLHRFNMRIAVIGRDQNNAYSKGKVYITARPIFASARVGDKICYLPNCTLPVVLRQDGDFYHYIGEVYSPPDEADKLRAYEHIQRYPWLSDYYDVRNFDKRISIY